MSDAQVPSGPAAYSKARNAIVQDLLWLAIMLGLLAATLAYVRLCDKA